MNHRERLEACISGSKIDRPPVALWRHFPVDDQSPGRLAEATINFQKTYDFDLVKVTPASSFCTKDWGVDDEWRGATEVGNSRVLRYDTATGAAVDLTQADDVEDANPVFSTDGKLIAFGRKYLDPARWTLGRPLWMMNADGSEVRQVMTDPLRVDYDLAWSLDGQQLAFVRFDQGAPTHPPELWLVNADGTEPLELVVGGYAPQWVP